MLSAVRHKDSSRPDTRQHPRASTYRRAFLVCGGSATDILLLDVSKGGALAHGLSPRTPGEAVWLQSTGLEIRARTAWVRGNRFGLAFSTPLTEAQLKIIAIWF